MEPKLKQHRLLCSCTLLLTFPVHAGLLPSCAEVQGGTAQPLPACPEPSASSCPQHPPFLAWCHCRAQCSCCAHPRCSQHSCPSSSPSCLLPMPQVLVPFTWATDPPLSLGERPQFLCSCSQAFPQCVTFPNAGAILAGAFPPCAMPGWCPGEYRDVSGVFCVPATDTCCCVNQFLIQNSTGDTRLGARS